VIRPLAILLLSIAGAGCDPVSNLKPDQEVLFFPTIAHRSSDGKGWDGEIHGCVYEEEKHRIALLVLREALQLRNVNLSGSENTMLAKRARLFMVDHERGKRIVVKVGNKTFELSESGPDGRVSGVFHITDNSLPNPGDATLAVRAVLGAGDSRLFTGQVSLFDGSGLTVISDIDDTIKITDVRDRNATLRNTFLEPFKPVPGMAEVYQEWLRRGKAEFCYVSASPWQLFLPLTEFIRSNGFPSGPFYLKEFRWKDESLLNLFDSPEKYKPKVIEPLLERFPHRRFVLVGDSGERDPEIYGALARKFPAQISRIFIRDVWNEPMERYQAAFREVSPAVWKIFRDPAEIAGLLP
jgi:phosphatidate phosphatase APP1